MSHAFAVVDGTSPAIILTPVGHVKGIQTSQERLMVTTERPIAVSIPDLSRLTGLSEGLLYQKANEGNLPGCRRIGKRFLVHLETFTEYLKSGMGQEQGA
jgi:hypothetical protein